LVCSAAGGGLAVVELHPAVVRSAANPNPTEVMKLNGFFITTRLPDDESVMQTLERETGDAAQLETCVSASYAQRRSEAIADGNAGPPSCCAANLPLCWPNRRQLGARLDDS